MNVYKRGVFQIADANIGMIIGMSVLAMIVIPTVMAFNSDNNYSIAAIHASKVSTAAEKYISDNFDTIANAATATTPYSFNANTLISAGYLPSGFTPTNNFSQSYQIQVLEPTSKKFNTLLVTTGGASLKTGQANKIALRIGATGGYIDSGIAKGAMGGWTQAVGVFGVNPGDGHIAIAQFFSNGVATNDFLYRKAVSGHPELNTMGTAINMGTNNLDNVGTLNASKGVLSSSLSVGGDTNTATLHVAGDSSVNGTAWANNTHTNNNTTTGSLNVAGDSSVNGTAYSNTTRTAGETYTGGWFRTTGDTGLYFEKWGGGFSMTDSTWIKAFNGKSIYTSGEIKGGAVTSDGRLTAGEFVQVNGVATAGNGCSPNGLVGRDAAGGILSCQSGVWKSSGAGKPGYYCRYTSMSKGKSEDYVGYTPRTDRNCPVISPGEIQGECACMKVILDY